MYLNTLLFIVGVGWVWKRRKGIVGWLYDDQHETNDSETLPPPPPPPPHIPTTTYHNPQERLKPNISSTHSYERKKVNSKPVQTGSSPIAEASSKPNLLSLPTDGEGKLRSARDQKGILGWKDDDQDETLSPTPPPRHQILQPTIKPTITHHSSQQTLKPNLSSAPYEHKEVNNNPVQNASSSFAKPTLLSLPTDREGKLRFARDQKGTEPIYMIPEDIKRLIERNMLPEVLRKPLSPSTYKDYFAALLYAEDFYMEKWSGFHVSNVKVRFSSAAIFKNPVKKNYNSYEGKGKKADEKMFAVFEIDKVRTKRPFLVSRDFVFAGPPNTNIKQFQGFVYRVVGGNSVVAEFQQDFHSQHHDSKRYDISFSFNRECLKRAHKALESSLDQFLMSFLFPGKGRGLDGGHHPLVSLSDPMLDCEQIMSAIHRISSFHSASPLLVRGPLCQAYHDTLSETGKVITLAVLHMYLTLPDCRILICAPKNKTCDVLMRSLRRDDIAEPDIFRANAAFREVDEVPDDILSSCPYEGECFVCPPVSELQKYKVIISTFMSAFRLRRQGMRAGHFTHIFLVDASSATEPETIVALAGLVDNNTSLIVTGDPRDHPYWIRSDFARENGLQASYFGRLLTNSDSY